MQFAGCGEHALPIVLPKELVMGTDDKTAKLLVHEWAHYRYGVFNEFGFGGDPLYPAFYSVPGSGSGSGSSSDSNNVKVTACSDGHYTFNYDTPNKCELTTDNKTGLPTIESQNCIPFPRDDNAMQSSLMYSQSLTNITKFCGFTQSNGKTHEHDVNSPNKQNVLCNGRDTWSIIQSHLDLEKYEFN